MVRPRWVLHIPDSLHFFAAGYTGPTGGTGFTGHTGFTGPTGTHLFAHQKRKGSGLISDFKAYTAMGVRHLVNISLTHCRL